MFQRQSRPLDQILKNHGLGSFVYSYFHSIPYFPLIPINPYTGFSGTSLLLGYRVFRHRFIPAPAGNIDTHREWLYGELLKSSFLLSGAYVHYLREGGRLETEEGEEEENFTGPSKSAAG